ncbi:MAG: nitroreductase, partial [Clostridia bacterium]|nr:nitroreductase [Clostridia bacterium]
MLFDNVIELIEKRHSVRQYKDIAIEKEKREILDAFAEELSKKSGLDIRVIYDEEKAFDSSMAHYGNFKNVKNYIAIFGEPKRDEAVVYYGELMALKAQEEGLNTCWV